METKDQGTPDPKSSSQKPAPTAQPRWKSSATFWADTINKAALPIVTAIVAFAGTIITSKINEANNLRTTVNQREQAETTLRSSMFRELVNPLLTPGAGDEEDKTKPQRLALLAELLALNFHEHFELGPLLTYVDEMPEQTVENRRRLRSVARRVISRQIAVLGQPSGLSKCAAAEELPTDLEIWLISNAIDPIDAPQACEMTAIEDGNKVHFTCGSGGRSDRIQLEDLVVSSPDCNNKFSVTLSELNWTSHSVRVYLSSVSDMMEEDRDAESVKPIIPEFVEFTLTQYALPFSDNTLLRDGNRFGLYIRQIEPSREPCAPPVCDPDRRLMQLSLIWFPMDFIPPRERPTDFKRIRKSLNM